MYRIAICDDEEIYRRTIRQSIEKEERLKGKLEFYEYDDGEKLLQDADKEFDLLFLDIQMSGLDGNETAVRYREHNQDTVLVFCTNYQLPRPENFRVEPFRYLMKEPDNQSLREELPAILEKMIQTRQVQSLGITVRGAVFQIPVKKILFIEKEKHGSRLYVQREKEPQQIACREKLEELSQRLGNSHFAYAHNSYIVNLEKVFHFSKKTLELENGQELSVSRSKAEAFEAQFMKYMKRKERG